MTTLHTIRQRLVEEFSELCEGLYAAQEWLEEGESDHVASAQLLIEGSNDTAHLSANEAL